jgi:hypothetical protein
MMARKRWKIKVLTDGRKIQFDPGCVNNRAIRILDAFGNELFIATVRFYK